MDVFIVWKISTSTEYKMHNGRWKEDHSIYQLWLGCVKDSNFLCQLNENVGCRYMKRQPLVDLFYNIYYSCTVYTDDLEFEELMNNNNSSELCNILNVVLKCSTELEL
jgi:hypothetical protein